MKIYNSINDSILNEINDILDKDGLIIFPTDTVYGIACNAFSEIAIKKLFLAKNRSFDKPIGILTDSVDKIDMIVKNISDLERELISKYFPGNLTIIFDKKEIVSNLLTANKNTIGVRIPNNEIALQILRNYKYPLATTSVNITGEKDGTKINDFINDFKGKVDIIIDGGETCEMPSTIVRVEEDNIIILRQGSLDVRNYK